MASGYLKSSGHKDANWQDTLPAHPYDIYLRNLSYFAAPLFLFNLSHKSLILTTGKKGHQA
jgi:hypothetical protein